jgi:two-component system, cell cycle sensor histidine kinase and response regulator CckA
MSKESDKKRAISFPPGSKSLKTGTVSKSLRVLNVEDSEADSELIHHHLMVAGYEELILERVDTAKAMKAALDRQTWDVILSDYSMPEFSALHALNVLEKSGLDVPFIIISGTIGEKIAVDAMRAGANDYLMKDNLARLAPAIEREMEDAANRRMRRQAEMEIERQRDRLNTIIASVPGVVWEAWGQPDAATQQMNFVSDYVETMLGYSVHEWLSTPNFWLSIVHPEDRAGAAWRSAEAFAGGKKATNEFRWIAKDGSTVWVESTSVTVVDTNGKPVGTRGVTIDISDRRRAEDASRDSEERYRLLFESNPDPIFVMDRDSFKFLAVNQAAVQTYGYAHDELLTMVLADIWLPPFTALEDDSRRRTLCKHRRKDGTPLDVELTGHALVLDGKGAYVILAHDITERRALEERFRQSQKMEAIGQLAGGIAHDFNNLLTAIGGFSDLGLSRLADGDPLRHDLEQIQRATQRAAALTRQLLAFSRKQVLLPTVVDLNVIVTEMEKMFRRLIGEDIALHTSLERGLGSIKADRGQIEQVIMNLVVNARDAMPYGGNISITTEAIQLRGDHGPQKLMLPGGPYVLLTISDTGIGMDEQTMTRIFEPFFTTKETGKGTGLGLSTVYGIIEQSGGSILVVSEVGRGTTFKVYLPKVSGAPQQERPGISRETLAGTETILLVEDDDMVRNLAVRVLTANSYRVLEASSAREALLLSERLGETIHIVIADMVMPEMNGRELAGRLLEIRPTVDVLFMSGYSDKAIVKQQVVDEKTPFLQKPFTPSALLNTVREILDRKR